MKTDVTLALFALVCIACVGLYDVHSRLRALEAKPQTAPCRCERQREPPQFRPDLMMRIDNHRNN